MSVYVWLCYNEREREKEQIQMKGLMCGTRWVVWVFCFVLFCFVSFFLFSRSGFIPLAEILRP